MNELEKYGIEVNIPEGTVINSKNIKMDDDGNFDITFKHKKSKKEVSAKFQASKKIVYVRELKEIEIEFKNGNKRTLSNINKDEFSYNIDVSKEEYNLGIKNVIAKDKEGKSVKVINFAFERGVLYITLENKMIEKESIKEKEFRFDGLNITLIKKQNEPKEEDDDENEDDEFEFHDGVYTAKIPGYNAIKKLEGQKENKLVLTVEDGKFKKLDFEYNDTQNILFTLPFAKNKKNLFDFVSKDGFDYFENEFLFDKIISICDNNIEVEEGKAQDKIKKDFKEVKDSIDVTTGATYSTKSLYEAMKDVLQQALQGSK